VEPTDGIFVRRSFCRQVDVVSVAVELVFRPFVTARPTLNARITAGRDFVDSIDAFRRTGKVFGRIFVVEVDQRPPVTLTVWNEMVFGA